MMFMKLTKGSFYPLYLDFRATPTTAADNFPVAKVADVKKLKTVSSERHVLGSELSSLAVSASHSVVIKNNMCIVAALHP